jgi:LuxR family transcriptional regulator, maltose regulon positive regulatory protein
VPDQRVDSSAAKIQPPPSPPGFIERAQLIGSADAINPPRVCLVSAPAGWGKTVLLSEWYSRCRAAGAVAWVSLDRFDNPDSFWRDLLSALRGASPDLKSALRALRFPSEAASSGFVASLISALESCPGPLTLIVDDVHVLTKRSVFDGIEQLVTRGPDQLRLVLSARSDPPFPISQWRMAGVLRELRTEQLRLSSEEAASLVVEAGLELPRSAVDTLLARTEGWVGGMRLACMSLRMAGDPVGAMANMARYQTATSAYLVEQVLSGLPDTERQFLRDTSIAEELPVELASALTGRLDAGALLARLVASIGFISPMSGRPDVFRYHQLLAETLRAELDLDPDPGHRSALHKSALGWLERNGDLVQAVRMAQSEEDWSSAERLLLRCAPALSVRGEASTVRSLVDRFPLDVVLSRPRLAMTAASSYAIDGQLHHLRRFAAAAVAGAHALEPAEARRAHRIGTMVDAIFHRVEGDFERMLAIMEKVARSFGGARSPASPAEEYRRATMLSNLGTAHLWLGHQDRAQEALGHGVEYARACGADQPLLNCLSLLAWWELMAGRLAAAARQAELATEFASERGWSAAYQSAGGWAAMAAIRLERGQFAEVERALAQAEVASASFEEAAISTVVATVRARLLLATGRPDHAWSILDKHRRNPRFAAHSPVLRDIVSWTEAEIASATNRWSEMQLALDRAEAGAAIRSLFAARQCLTAGNAQGAVRHLRSAQSEIPLGRQLGVRIRINICYAAAAREAGQRETARRQLNIALTTAQDEGHVMPFHELGERCRALLSDTGIVPDRHCGLAGTILASFPQLDSTPIPEAVGLRSEPLTRRELDVLGYLPSRLSFVEIAETLGISLNTVKVHQRSIYRKLHATKRNDAVTRAQARQLI